MDYFGNSLEGKIGIVSGAGMGQGKAVVKLLLDNGAKVVAFSRGGNKPDIEHKNLRILKGDSSDLSSLQKVKNSVEKEFGRLNFLYNNHGLFGGHRDEFGGNLATEFFQKNVVSSINTIETFHPLMKNGGSIVSVGASPAIFHLSSLEYAVSKRAVEEMTRKMASILKPKNIRVNAVMPGSVDATKDIEDLTPFNFGKLEGRKVVTTLEVAYTAIFLLSDLSYGINGQSIVVDGGLGL